MRGAHENGHIIKAHRIAPAGAARHRLDLLADPARLLLAVPMADQPDLFALGFGSPKLFAQTVRIARDHAGRGGQNMRGRAVILLKPHHMRSGKILFKPQDIAHFGAAPAVDRLIVIAHAADVFMRPRQKPQPQILRHIGVLVFVHEDIFEPTLILPQHVVVGLKNCHHMQEQIAKIHGVQLQQALLILLVKLDAITAVGAAFRGGHLAWRQGAVFPPVNHPRQHPRGPAFVVNRGQRDQLLQKPDLVIRVQNREIRFQPRQFRVTAQQFHANRMEGAQPRHAFGGLTEHLPDADFHLARGLIGKGHRQNLVGRGASGVEQMHDPRGQGFGLARPRPRQHQNRPVHRLDGGALFGVQPLQIGGRTRGHGARREGGALEGVIFIKTAHGAKIARLAPK